MTDRLSDLALHRLDELSRIRLGGGAGDCAEVYAVLLGVDAERGILAAEQGGEHLVQAALGDAEGLQSSSDYGDLRVERAQPGADLVVPHMADFPGRAGHGGYHAAISLDPPAGGGSHGIGNYLGGRDEGGLLYVGGGHGYAAALELRPEVCEQVVPHLHLLAHDRRD